jgi:Trk-type K+ transport system membrane component
VKRRDQKKLQAKSPQVTAAPAPEPARPRTDEPGESPAWRFAGAYLLLVLIGFIVYRHPSAMIGGNEMSVDRAMFTSINAVTLTGFQQTLAIDEYRWPGKIAALLLTIGGTLTTLIGGGMAVSRIARTCCADRTIIVVAAALQAVVLVFGAVTLTGRGRSVFEAISQAASAFGHSGLLVGALPAVDGGRTHLVLLPLSILGALGIPVLLCIVASIRQRKPLHPYVRLVLILWGASYVIGMIALVFLNGEPEWRDAIATASVQSVNSRTTGLPFPIGDARPGHWILMLLMTVGGVSGAAAGGLKLTTIWRIFGGIRSAMRGEAPGRVFAIAVTWLALYALLVFVTVLCLLATEPGQPGDRLLFLAISAVSNVGLAHNPVSIVKEGMFVLSGAMLLGRLVPLGILWWVVAVTRDEEDAPIG